MIEKILIGIAIALFLIIPVSIKWGLNKKIVIPYSLVIGVMSGLIVYLIDISVKIQLLTLIVSYILLIGIISTALLLWRFYRDPDRNISANKNEILSPADGKVIYIKKIENGEIPISTKKKRHYTLLDLTQTNLLSNAAYQVGIEMSYLDVHVNRAPIDGKVSYINHIKGKFKSLKISGAIFENERSIMIIDGSQVSIGLVFIASRLVRMIVAFVKKNDRVKQGERIGKIRFGSQVDIIIPNVAGLKILVNVNQYVKAGLDCIASIKESSNQ